MKYVLLTTILALSLGSFSYAQNPKLSDEPMTNKRMGSIVRKLSKNVEGRPGFWQFEYNQKIVLIITDEAHNRMRIMTPIVEQKKISNKEMVVLLESNFDRALDAKYALNEGILWSVFTHPLGELQKDQFIDAVKQVVTLAEQYGTTYTSSDLVFGGRK